MAKLPPSGGLPLHPAHFSYLRENGPNAAWMAFRPEDFLALGGPSHRLLETLSEQCLLSMQADGLSIGSAESTDEPHLQNVKGLAERYQPVNITTTMSWSRWQGKYLGANLPLPYTLEALDQATFNLHTIQNTLGRRVLVRNYAQALPFADEQIAEAEFFESLVRNTGCGLVLDITQLYASALNQELDPFKVLRQYPLAAVKEVHLSGHTQLQLNDDKVSLIADDSMDISKPVLQLFKEMLNAIPSPIATLIKRSEEGIAPHELEVELARVNNVIQDSLAG